MQNPFSDPLVFWSQVLTRLGLVLAALAVAPAVIDILIFKGAAAVVAVLALYALVPLALLSLVAGGGLWVVNRFKK